MGARKGQNNFGAHQERVAGENLRKVKLALDSLSRRRKADYADLNELIGAVAAYVRLHPTTVSRNAGYRAEVLRWVARNPRKLRNASEGDLPLVALKAKAVGTEVEAIQLRRENARLKALIERRGLGPDGTGPTDDPAAESERQRRAFESTATVLARLLAHLAEEDFGIVLDGGEIRNMAQVGARSLVAGPPDTNAYVRWWRRQPTTRDQGKGER